MKRYGTALTLSAVLAGVGLLAAPSPAHAGFNIALDSTSTSGGSTVYTYSASINTDDAVYSGNFFRIYDFYGYVPGTISAPAGWTATTALQNNTPPPSVILNHGDDPTVPNLVFTYNGPTAILGSTTSTITGFTAVSTNPLGNTKDFVGQTTKAVGPTAGSLVGTIGDITVPATAVPEPAAMISSGLGLVLLGLGYAARTRRRSATA